MQLGPATGKSVLKFRSLLEHCGCGVQAIVIYMNACLKHCFVFI